MGSRTIENPRSPLHALKPLGVGTGEVESLLSYLCRLAVSHSTSTLSLSRAIAQRFELDVQEEFDWHHRRLSGMDDAALTWSSALSALTSMPRLDRLTFLPWRDVIGKNGLRMVGSGQFCPLCLAEDRAQGQVPYFRLAWELKAVAVCPTHGVRLRQRCPCCGKSGVRHQAALVMPGWCTKCGAFLGDEPREQRDVEDDAITAHELWQAREVAALLAAQGRMQTAPRRRDLVNAIRHLIAELDKGQSARFAKRVAVSKSTVHYWLHGETTPTLEASLNVASQCAISLVDLLQGNTSGWSAPSTSQQLTLLKPEPLTHAPSRNIDWQDIEARLQKILCLPTPISVREAARRLEMEPSQLYLHVNQVTRQLSQRWAAYTKRQRVANLSSAVTHLTVAVREALADGKSPNLREMSTRLDPQVLHGVQGLFGVLQDLRTLAESSQPPAA